MLSKEFIAAVKLNRKPQYKIAWEAGVNPTVLSQILIGYIKQKTNDERVIAIGRVIGLEPDQCFSEVDAHVTREK